MKFKIDGTIWEIREYAGPKENNEDERFICTIFRNGKIYNTCCGSNFETESGAAYAILNEYQL